MPVCPAGEGEESATCAGAKIVLKLRGFNDKIYYATCGQMAWVIIRLNKKTKHSFNSLQNYP